MSDYSELKKLAEALIASDSDADFSGWMDASDAFENAFGPEVVLALIAEIERLRADYASLATFNPDWDRVAAAQDTVREHMELANQLRAELAGLRTGYEAFERVNAELRGEVEGLRDDLDQKKYDADAWCNREESVWIQVFMGEGDDPFISAINGAICIEQISLMQADLREYAEDYFEHGSGFYVFECRHFAAHYDNVGMTEPDHWEMDFSEYARFPWADEHDAERAAMVEGDQP